MTTNATDQNLAQNLSNISTDGLGVGQGTMVSIVLRKKGTTIGGTTYGDDTVHVLVWTGFHYKALVERSLKKLDQLWESGTLFRDLLKEAIDHGTYDATIDDVAAAVQELRDSLSKVASSTHETPVGEPSHDVPTWWEPLVVNGEPVLGAKVYIGQSKTIDKGTIYIDGVKLGEKILAKAANPKRAAKSKAKTVIKDILRDKLPVGLYARYSLNKKDLISLDIGNNAVTMVKTAGVTVDPSAIRSLFKIAA